MYLWIDCSLLFVFVFLLFGIPDMEILHKQAIPLEYYVQVSKLFVSAGPCNKEQIPK